MVLVLSGFCNGGAQFNKHFLLVCWPRWFTLPEAFSTRQELCASTSKRNHINLIAAPFVCFLLFMRVYVYMYITFCKKRHFCNLNCAAAKAALISTCGSIFITQKSHIQKTSSLYDSFHVEYRKQKLPGIQLFIYLITKGNIIAHVPTEIYISGYYLNCQL